jgi:hypothetical protein
LELRSLWQAYQIAAPCLALFAFTPFAKKIVKIR